MRHIANRSLVCIIFVSISDEKPLHMRRRADCSRCSPFYRFNLRREAAPHATACIQALHAWIICFNLRREAAPHATPSPPLLKRWITCFNLRREAAPHATSNQASFSGTGNNVSISDEKPLHMRLCSSRLVRCSSIEFQSQTRSRSTCDFKRAGGNVSPVWFQSQTRSRSTCDTVTGGAGGPYTLFQSQTRSRSTCASCCTSSYR